MTSNAKGGHLPQGQAATAITALIMLLVAGEACPCTARADVLRAGPEDFIPKIRALAPGDTLKLAPGEYPAPLRLAGMHGEPNRPIVITGPDAPLEAVLLGPRSKNTLELTDASYLVIRRLTFDGRNIADDAIKAGDLHKRPVHHITIERCTIIHHGRHQKYVGINVQVPAWDWIIRRNRIMSAGTGIYLGDARGEFPFIRGLIEYNLVQNPKGYCLQIKHLNSRPRLEGIPDGPCENVIRHNVFAKNDAVGKLGNRPNVLLDGFPDTGPGSRDRHRFYGNLVMNNPRESLLQGSGRLSIHDNIFVSSKLPAVNLHAHEGKAVRSALVYHNTIFADGEAVRVSGTTQGAEVAVVGNIMASGKMRDRAAVRMSGNLVMGLWKSKSIFATTSSQIEKMDLQPLREQTLKLPPSARALLEQDRPLGRDFAGRRKTTWDYCGAMSQAYSKPMPLLKLVGPDTPDRDHERKTGVVSLDERQGRPPQPVGHQHE